MAQNVIEKEAAEQELKSIVDFFELDPEGEGWDTTKAKIVNAIQKGRIILDESASTIVLTLASPIILKNGEEIGELTLHEPSASDLRIFDKYGASEGMAKTIHLASKMTGQAIDILDRLGARDLQTLSAVASLFF